MDFQHTVNHTWLDHFNQLPVHSFEKFGGFLLYIYIILQFGYATHYLVDRYIIPTLNRFAVLSTFALNTSFHVPFVMQTASTLPELCIGFLGLVFMNYYTTSSALIIGSSFLAVVVMSGLSSILSHESILISKVSFTRESLILLLGVMFYYVFSISLPSNEDIKYGKLLLWLSIIVYMFYLLAIHITNKYSKTVYSVDSGVALTTPFLSSDKPITPNKLHSELLLVKSPDFSEIVYSSSQWTEHWTDLYSDEIIIRKDRSPHSPPLVTINTDDIVQIISDTLDENIFDIETIEHRTFGFLSLRRGEWVAHLNRLLPSGVLISGLTWKDLLRQSPIKLPSINGKNKEIILACN
ncbi:Sodium/calcium exchanger membrane region domain-containing protein [Entamoeba marina]